MNYRVSTRIRDTRLSLVKALEFTLGADKVYICASATPPAEAKKAEFLNGIAETDLSGSAEMLTLLDDVIQGRAQADPARNKEILAFCVEINARLIRQIESVVSALRWRCGISDGPADTLSDMTYEYSVDGVRWRSITFIPSFKIKVSGRAMHTLTRTRSTKA
jgi:hypothetical protein